MIFADLDDLNLRFMFCVMGTDGWPTAIILGHANPRNQIQILQENTVLEVSCVQNPD